LSGFDRIHAVCASLRTSPCKLCPAQEPSVYGPMTKGCRLLAQEVYNIAVHGNSLGADADQAHVAIWQQHYNDGEAT
jgi:hypothetical protein